MEKQGIDIDRKILADLAISDPNAFKKVAQAAGAVS
jgi:ribosomal protein L20